MAKRTKPPKKLTRRRRGRPPKKKKIEERGYHIIDCRECGRSAELPKSAVKYTCSFCVTDMMPHPPTPVRKQTVKSKLAALQKADDKAAGPIDAIMPRGWHRRKLFEITVAGKKYYYSKGKEIKASEYKALLKEAEPSKSHSGFGRGWHLKKVFVAPNGDKYSYGKKVK